MMMSVPSQVPIHYNVILELLNRVKNLQTSLNVICHHTLKGQL